MAYLSQAIAGVVAFKTGAQASYVPFTNEVKYELATVIELRIPAGAQVYYGVEDGYDIIAASEVYVVKEAGHEPSAG